MTEQDQTDRPIYAVIGASGGMGRALCRRLSGDGAGLLLAGRTLKNLEEVAAETGGIAVELDASNFDAVEDFLGRAKDLDGTLRGVANLAGSLHLKPAHRTQRDEWDAVVADNLTTAFATVRAGAKAMRKGGSIVLISSAAASTGLASHEAIAAAKGGVSGLTRSAAASYASKKLRVNAVAPGLVETPLTAQIMQNDMAREASLSLHPLGRAGKPEEVASLVAWLLGEESQWVTGQIWSVDGGLAHVKGKGRA